MHRKALTGLLLVPVLDVLATTPAYAIFGSILAGLQRAQMIANQGVQIYKDTMAKITFDRQLTQMTDQFAHLKEQALGSVGALRDPFTDLASAPAEFIGVGQPTGPSSQASQGSHDRAPARTGTKTGTAWLDGPGSGVDRAGLPA